MLDCFPSSACFEWFFSLAGAAITDKPVPTPLGEMHRVWQSPKWANSCFCAATERDSTGILVAAGQNRTQGTPGANNTHFIMCCMKNKNKSAVTTKPSNNCLLQWAASHLASEDYFILVELVTESLWQLYERGEQPCFWDISSIKENLAPSFPSFLFSPVLFAVNKKQ